MTTQRPAWWQLFGLGVLLMAALVWVHRLGLPDQAEMPLHVLGLALLLGLTLAWLGINTPALLHDKDADGLRWYPPVEIPPARAENDDPERPAPPEPAAAPQRELDPVIFGRVLD